jgi:peptidoglycan hydrolase-like protein with peptidoglycan-binding domain
MDPIARGDGGEAVRDVQRRLLAGGLRIDAEELQGTYGPSTEGCVREFQQMRGLPADGVVGAETWGQLVEAGYRLGDRTLYLRSPAFRGDDVRELQLILNALGFDAGKQDGIFGRRTADAVREFQRNVAAKEDGIVGLDTVREMSRFRPTLEGPSRAIVREEEAAREPGFALPGSVVAIDAEDQGGTEVVASAITAELRRRGARPLLLRSEEPSPVTDRITLELNRSLVGTLSRVLIDGTSRRDPEVWQGRGEDNRVVNFPRTGTESVGDVVDVRIVRAAPHSLIGEAVGDHVPHRLPFLPPA